MWDDDDMSVDAPPQGREASSATPSRSRLPPGPRLPAGLQMLGFMLGGRRFLALCARRYGGAVSMRTPFDDGFVMVFDPALVREVFQGPHEQLNAGEANALLGPLLGDRSVLVLDGSEHLRHRRLMLPPFHGQRMRGYEQIIRAAIDAEIDSWPLATPFTLRPSLQTVTLSVIVRAVFGYSPGAAEAQLRERLAAMIDPVTAPRGLFGLFVAPRLGLDHSRRRFEAARAAVDALLFAEIARRRADPGLETRDDVFSMLVAARDEDGALLSPQEVRDELVTLLVAGHETTATGLAWALDLLLHDRAVLARARAGDDAYLDAVVKESLRLAPVIPAVGRVVRGAPFPLGDWLIPVGVEINPSINVIHHRSDLYPDPGAFRPERFLDPAAAPDIYTWLPFGGGTRRCLGASFAQLEMRVILARILERADLAPLARRRERAVLRAITLAPRHGVRVIQRHPPRPGR